MKVWLVEQQTERTVPALTLPQLASERMERKEHSSTSGYLTPAPSVRSLSSHSIYARNEKEKRRKYQQRVCEVEQGSFTPLVFSSSGGMSKATTVTIKRLATLPAEKHGESYSRTVGWLRTVFRCSLLRSAIASLRGTRRLNTGLSQFPSVRLVASEGRLPSDV